MEQHTYQEPSYQQPYYPPPAAPTSGMAIASLVLSILGLVGILPLIGSVIGVVLGYMAKGQIVQSQGLQGGMGVAKAGIVIGWVTIGIYLLVGCLFLVFGIVLPVIGVGGATACGLCETLGNMQY